MPRNANIPLALRQDVRQKAEKAWAGATDNQKAGIRFGMNDVALLKGAGFDPYSRDQEEQDLQHQFILDLMDCASKNGGMRA